MRQGAADSKIHNTDTLLVLQMCN